MQTVKQIFDRIKNESWRFSKEFKVVTTSKVGISEGSQKICQISDFARSEQTVHENGVGISLLPELIKLNEALVTALKESNQLLIAFKPEGPDADKNDARSFRFQIAANETQLHEVKLFNIKTV